MLDSAYYALTSYKIYEPSFLYAAVPERNVAKMRALEGNAYVDFPVSETVIYPDYHSNRSELEKIVAQIDSVRLDPDVSVKSIFIKGYASPESPYDNNTRLAKGRTEAIRSYVEDMYDFPDGLITTDYEPENWEELRAYVAASKLPSRKRILELIDKDEEPDRKEWLIKSRYKGEYQGIREMRKHVAWYTAGYHGSARMRQAVNEVESYEALKQLLADWLAYSEGGMKAHDKNNGS